MTKREELINAMSEALEQEIDWYSVILVIANQNEQIVIDGIKHAKHMKDLYIQFSTKRLMMEQVENMFQDLQKLRDELHDKYEDNVDFNKNISDVYKESSDKLMDIILKHKNDILDR